MSYLAYSCPIRNSSGIIISSIDNRGRKPKFQGKPASARSKHLISHYAELKNKYYIYEIENLFQLKKCSLANMLDEVIETMKCIYIIRHLSSVNTYKARRI